jgi:MFS family permease
MPLRLLIFLTLVNILNYFDRYIVHSVEPLLKAEFNISNESSGYIVSAFVWGYFLFSPLFGYLGNKADRRVLMAVGLCAWSIATFYTGLTAGFAAFFFARILVGIGEASFGTIVPGYLKGRINDTVKLNNAFSLFYCAIPVGAALGYVIGGYISDVYSWRHVFQFAAIPGFLLMFGFFFLAPDSGYQEKNEGGSSVLIDLKRIVQSPIIRLSIIGYIFNTFALQGIAAFVVRYGVSLGMEMTDVTKSFGIILFITGFVGTFVGGSLASYFAKSAENKPESLLRFVSLSTLVGVPFLALAFVVGSPSLFLWCCFAAELLLFASVAPLNSVLVECAPSRLETLTQGVAIFSINLFGSIFGPVIIGKVADILKNAGYVAEVGAPYLSYALQLSTVTAIASVLFWWMAAKAAKNAPITLK